MLAAHCNVDSRCAQAMMIAANAVSNRCCVMLNTESQVSRLAAELETTRRRVKALEKHMIKKKSSQSSMLTALPASSELE
jgi:vacuolar-type H+-ATPase subunit D/Vma8